jgi:hypothetical protein
MSAMGVRESKARILNETINPPIRVPVADASLEDALGAWPSLATG